MSDNQKEFRLRNRNFVNRIKEYNGCCICGDTRYYVLDLHHLDTTTKKYSVSYATSHTSALTTIVEELNKCSCLCSNCHRELHHIEKESGYLPELKLITIQDSEVISHVKSNKNRKVTSTGLIGVKFRSNRNKYVVEFRRKDFKEYKYFDDRQAAKEYYDITIVKLDGENAITNKMMGLV